MNTGLKNLTVLVTRPAHQADNFVDLVEEAGGVTIRFPVIEILPLELHEAEGSALQQNTDCLIFISANAVRLGVAALNRLAPGKLASTRVMAIGQATAKALQEHGVTPDLVPPSPFNSEALLGMPEMQHISARRYLIIKGKGGREYLQEQLRARGGIVNTVDVYVRSKPVQSNEPLQQLSLYDNVVVAITSVKGLHYLFEMASAEQSSWLKQHARFLVPGSRVADAIRDLHVKHLPLIAENATDEVMFKRLLDSA
jgi:uroporphyrinogen-III synthase